MVTTIYDVKPDSTLLVGWICRNGHPYKMRVCDRVKNADVGIKNDCPVCNLLEQVREKGITIIGGPSKPIS